MRKITEVIIHASATRRGWMDGARTSAKVAEIKRWHMEGRGWSDIGYHFLIDLDGTVATGRPISRIGAHVKGHNTGTIGICLIGGHGGSATDQFADHFTPEQDKAVRKLIASLEAKYGKLSVTGHNEYANKGCPCFSVPAWLSGAQATTTSTATPKATADPVGGFWAAIAAFFAAWKGFK